MSNRNTGVNRYTGEPIIEVMAKDLGMVTAYAYAVAGGYTGTEEEFEELLGNIAIDLAEIENISITVNTLPEGSTATASYDHGAITLGIPKGDTGATGATGNGIQSITKTGTSGLTDTYTILYTNGQSTTFTVKNGAKGDTGATGNGIQSIYLSGESGAVKTYTILYTNGDTFEYQVTDGEVTNASMKAYVDPQFTNLKETKADINGIYDDLVSGSSEQLLSDNYLLDTDPYTFRPSPRGDREFDEIVGGTVAWNQLAKISGGTKTDRGITATIDSDGTVTLSGTSTATHSACFDSFDAIKEHKYVSLLTVIANPNNVPITARAFNINWTSGNMCNASSTIATSCGVVGFSVGTDLTGIKLKWNIIDLTQMFGSTIANYIYSLEQANAGAGVAFFKKYFGDSYKAYDSGSIKSVEGLVSHDTVGFNQWDEETANGYWDGSTGEWTSSSNWKACKNYIPCFPNTAYYFNVGTVSSGSLGRVCYYDADKNFISSITSGWGNAVVTTPSNARYMTFYANPNYFANDICINLSGSRNGEYEPYIKHSYPLDSSVTLRGLFKLVDGKIQAYGDIYHPTKGISRIFDIVDLGDLSWTKITTAGGVTHFQSSTLINSIKPPINHNTTVNAISTKFTLVPWTSTEVADFIMAVAGATDGNAGKISCQNHNLDNQTAGDFKASVTGIYLVYEKLTPTTESADPYQSPQIVSEYGTEEYVSTSVIPIGHNTKYPDNLRKKLDNLPWDFSSIIAPTESGTASRNYTVGQLLIMGNVLYQVTQNIASGGAITPNTNCTATTLSEIIANL